MSNSSLLRCSAAFLILSVYIWLFGITGIIEDEPSLIFADESLEFSSADSADEQDSQNEETKFLSALNAGVNPTNEPKPGFVDLPGLGSPEFGGNTIHDIDTVPFAVGGAGNSEPIVLPPSAVSATDETTSESVITTTAPPISSEPVTFETPPAEEITTPAIITTDPIFTASVTLAPAPTEIVNSDAVETSLIPAMTERLTVETSNGQVTDTALNIVSRIVQYEIGSSFEIEAIKAQAVASYTYIMHYQSQGGVARAELASNASERVIESVRAVLGLALYHNGNYIPSVYHSSSAGYTASSMHAWGGDLPFLRSVQTSFDAEHDPNYGLTTTFSATEIRVAVLEKTGINLTGDPSQWLAVLSYVDSVYIGAMTIGGRSSYTDTSGREIEFTGMAFRNIMGTRTLRSPSFHFTYNSETDTFTFTTHGYGHGVGMSQNGANILARHYGYDFRQILAFYYPGTVLA